MDQVASEVEEIIEKQKSYYYSQKTKPVSFRLKQLQALKDGIKKYETDVNDALKKDLNKSEFEAYSTELGIVYEEISFSIKNLKKWVKPKKVKTALTHVGSKGYIMPEPYGVTLIIAPWNYPFQLALSPLVGAIAAGNTAVLKPSELTPTVSAVITRIISEVFPSEYIEVIEGGVETSQTLLEQPFDYIFFTGSVPVGKIVMEAASKQLIPLTLELGGKSPCIVHHDANIKLAAKRIVFGKYTNAGQTCIAPDYLLVHENVKEALVEEMKQVVAEFYGSEPIKDDKYGKIVNEPHFDRVASYLNDGQIVFGGKTDRDTLKIEPTFIEGASWDSPVMQDEIFGPIFPMFTYSDLSEVIEKVNNRPKPLALYLFTQSDEVERLINSSISYGGGTVNDTLMHIATPYLPFGGVGESGMGSYHGEGSFHAFSHMKSVLKQTTRFDMSFRYPSAKNGLAMVKRFFN
ncbi:aldehyde dehydrogenase [Bacillus solimangrovi]|uniref:Aldehyde dehydrogenase n=1 Tax=Bacillus solimangrovi TaxID=1305675 RepID=A0A1E5LKF1_9BACI|nr:aldehyde dehydrogenase [Bacillus solimangrovi]